MRVVMLGVHAEALEPLVARGHEVTVLFEPAERDRVSAVREKSAQVHQVESYTDVDGLLAALEEIGARARGVEAVVTLKEFAVVPAALLGAVLGARALNPKVALRCRDKALQKTAWRQAGLATAKWVVVPAGAARAEEAVAVVRAQGLRAPFIVKPIASAGTVGVRAAADEAGLVTAVREIEGERPSGGRLLVEERNEGEEWHFDGFVRDGRVDEDAVLVSRYLTPLIETRNGSPTASASFHPAAEPDLYKEAAALATEASRALGLDNGAFHFEVFGEPGSFVAGELAARPGGGWVRRAVKAGIGVDLAAAAVGAVTGDRVEVGEVSDDVFGWAYLQTVAGSTNHVRPEDVLEVPGVAAVEMSVVPGAPMPDMRTSSTTGIGIVLARGEDHAACAAVLRAANDAVVRINGVPGGDVQPDSGRR
ncbi:biotin carboxylase [Catenulispora sp. GP43]|uniref:ATP-grasp domain-containing protein n=1 Tax=Catenulispora sp. GP43 TaxID=3156263 RepID=UPI0035153355